MKETDCKGLLEMLRNEAKEEMDSNGLVFGCVNFENFSEKQELDIGTVLDLGNEGAYFPLKQDEQGLPMRTEFNEGRPYVKLSDGILVSEDFAKEAGETDYKPYTEKNIIISL